jgi:hypothetical protein
MATEQEEVLVKLGVDVNNIDRQLGIGKSKFQGWRRQMKSDEQEYTNWWMGELKKREEAQTASDVRAATRANAARRLIRQRQAAATERAMESIGQGSIPEDWDKMTKAAERSAKSATESWRGWGRNTTGEIRNASDILSVSFTESARKTAKALKNLFAINLVSAVMIGLEQWEKFTKFMAEHAFNLSGLEKMGQTLQRNADTWRKLRIQAQADREAAAKEQIELARQWKEITDKNEESADASMQLHLEQLGRGSKEALEFEKSILAQKAAVLQIDLDQAKAAGDKLKILETETKLEKIKLDIFRNQKAIKDLPDETRKDHGKAGSLQGRLDDINAMILGDEHRLQFVNNETTRGTLRRHMQERGEILRRFRANPEGKDIKDHRQEAVYKMTDTIMAMLKKEGIPVKAMIDE